MKSDLEFFQEHAEDITRYNSYRRYFRIATRKSVEKVFYQYVKWSDSLLEIGSGAGELANLVPRFYRQIQQTEVDPVKVELNRALDESSNITEASAFDLPFGSGKFDGVVGYNVFDMLPSLEDPLSEVRRVVKPDGIFIHLLDLQASPQGAFREGYIPFPLFEKDSRTGLTRRSGIQLVKLADLHQITSRLGSYDSTTQRQVCAYLADPEEMFCSMCCTAGADRILKDISDVVSSSGVERATVRLNEDFSSRLAAALKAAGFEILESRKRGAGVLEKKSGVYKGREYNVYFNDVGEDLSRFDPMLAKRLKDNVIVVSRLYATVAKKGNST